MAFENPSQTGFWRPNSRRFMCPGRSKHETGMLAGEGLQGPKLTTYERCNASIEEYWTGRATQGVNTSSCSTYPDDDGGDLSKGVPENANKRTNVVLGQGVGFYIPDCETAPRDLEEKEKSRTRGIPGYTGTQPPLDRIRPWRPSEEEPQPSQLYAINAFDGRRPRVKGIAGYTGHQPHTMKNAFIETARASSAESSQQEPRLFDDGTEMTADQKVPLNDADGKKKEEEFWRKTIQSNNSTSFPPAEAGIDGCSDRIGDLTLESGRDDLHNTSHDNPGTVECGTVLNGCEKARSSDRVDLLESEGVAGVKRAFPFKMHVGF